MSRRLLARDIPAYIDQLERTIATLRSELAIAAVRNAEAEARGYAKGHEEGRIYERAIRNG